MHQHLNPKLRTIAARYRLAVAELEQSVEPSPASEPAPSTRRGTLAGMPATPAWYGRRRTEVAR
jgi:hypothetical protein